jgi:SAM-dependent methyltransferase
MSFSAEWDQRYKENTHMSVWPWSEIVSYVTRHVRPGHRPLSVLELGVGAGANVPFLKSIAQRYCGIEGSPSIVEKVRQGHPELKNNIFCGDFTREIPFEGTFDVVIDRSSLTHNSTEAIRRCLDLVYDKMTPGGKYIGTDWFSTEYPKYKDGEQAEDVFTRTNITAGKMANVGRVHFSDEEHLRDLFRKFDFELLEHKKIERKIPDDGWIFAVWNFVAVKRS